MLLWYHVSRIQLTWNCRKRLRLFPGDLILTALTNLRSLSLAHNHLSALPENISCCTDLEKLNLCGNQLVNLPSFEACKKLIVLNISSNKLSRLAAQVGRLSSLTALHADHNELTQIDDLGGMHSLQVLTLDGSPLKFGLPPSISVLRTLTELSVNFCFTRANAKRRAGKLPALDALEALAAPVGTLSTPLALEKLCFRGNSLSEFPEFIGAFTRMTCLNLSQNALSVLPLSVGQLSCLKILRIDRNVLTSLPTTIGNLASLTNLVAHTNHLESLPSSFASLRKITNIDLAKNRLNFFPVEIGCLRQLKKLDISLNHISSIPGEHIQGLVKLQELNMRGNVLGSLPDALDQMRCLESLDISHNRILQLPGSMQRMLLLADVKVHDNPCTSGSILVSILLKFGTTEPPF